MTDLLLKQESGKLDSLLNNLASSRYLWTDQLARPEQLPTEEDWSVWLYLAGRGAGKTRTAAEWMAWEAIKSPKTRWAVVAATFSDVRDTCAEGESGLVSILKRYGALENYNRSMGEIRLTNGSRIKLFSADEPDRLRGPQFHGAWCDELAAWRYEDTWDQLQFGLRLGEHPRTLVTTTPRPVPIIKRLLERTDGSVKLVRGSTFDNAKNLAPSALAQLRARYEGTRLGRQELYAEVLTDTPGALFTQALIDDKRVQHYSDFTRVVVAVDPAVTLSEDSDETGIVVVGLGADGRFYVMADRSCKDTPLGWSKRVVQAYEDYQADRVVVETNQGGSFIETTLRQINPNMAITGVVAKIGKRLRAEPISSLYEQGRVSHIGNLSALETQMIEWVPDSGESPDRLDALVHGITSLTTQTSKFDLAFSGSSQSCPKCGASNLKTDTACKVCFHKFNPATEQRINSLNAGFPQFQKR